MHEFINLSWSDENIRALFRRLSPFNSSIILNGTSLKSISELVQFVKTLPTSVFMLSLHPDFTKTQTARETAQIVAAMLPPVQILNLYYNALGRKDTTEVIDILSAVPASIIELQLLHNNLGLKSGEELVKILKSLHRSLICLDLSRNEFGLRTATELVDMLGALPDSVSRLDLSFNDLGSKTPEDLVKILKAIPQSVTVLDLSCNKFGKKSVAELMQILTAIPASVTSVSLDDLDFEKFSIPELIQIASALPDTVKKVSFRFELKLDMEDIRAMSIEQKKVLVKFPINLTCRPFQSIPSFDIPEVQLFYWQRCFTNNAPYFYFKANEIKAMSPQERQYLEIILTKIAITITDDRGKRLGVIPACEPEAQKYYFSRICRTGEIPTLKASAAFFVKHRMSVSSTAALDDNSKEFLNNFRVSIPSA